MWMLGLKGLSRVMYLGLVEKWLEYVPLLYD